MYVTPRVSLIVRRNRRRKKKGKIFNKPILSSLESRSLLRVVRSHNFFASRASIFSFLSLSPFFDGFLPSCSVAATLSFLCLSLSLLFTLTRDTRIRIERGGTGAHTLSPTADLATRDSREAASENDRFKKNVFLFVSGICNRVYEVARRTLQEEVRRRK